MAQKIWWNESLGILGIILNPICKSLTFILIEILFGYLIANYSNANYQ